MYVCDTDSGWAAGQAVKPLPGREKQPSRAKPSYMCVSQAFLHVRVYRPAVCVYRP